MLGSALLRSFEKNSEIETLGVTRQNSDLRDKSEFGSLVEAFRPDTVVHAAAKVGGIQANIDNPFGFLNDNLQMDTNVISTCLDHGVQNFLYIGSSCMYPKDCQQPLTESNLLSGAFEPTNEGYALAKIAGAKLCEFASSSAGVSYRTVIPSNLYGPGDNFDPRKSHLIASIIRKVHDTKSQGKKSIEVWGGGQARREFTFTEDLADWLVSVCTRVEELPPYLNVGFGQDFTVTELYEAAMNVIGVSAHLEYDLTKPEGMERKLLDSSRALQEANWKPRTQLQDGLAQTYQWYLNHKQN